MREIYSDLFVGPQLDYENDVMHREGWRVVHAAKEPYHRQAAGYQGIDPPVSHPEYLFAKRRHRLMLNLIDAPVEVDIPCGILDAALAFIHESLSAGAKVLVHCEQGVSRSASICMLYLRRHTKQILVNDYLEAEAICSRIYPPFNPGKAIRYFLKNHWTEYEPDSRLFG